MRKLTTEEFIEKAKEVHGDKYDYSKVDYVNNRTKVCLICAEHGEFEQQPNNHLNGQGCSKCGIKSYTSDTKEFIERAKELHGNKYDYSKVGYKDNKKVVIIICPIHGEFEQSPCKHLQGQGCPKCVNKNVTTEEFVEKAKEVHGDKYDYSKVEYVNNHKKVCIICPIHGEFKQRPSSHLNGQGCSKCSGTYQPTTEEFIEKAKEIHGNKYNYSKVEYVNALTKVIIICPIHGDFEQSPVNHLQGAGCHSCGGTKNLSTEEFIEKAKEIHGDKYDYSKVNYVNNKEIVIIICPIHGEFKQKPNSHLNGHGCPSCNESKLEKYTAKLLDENNVVYERQKRFKWLGRQSLDFYLPDYNIAIECQGEQHFEPSSFGSKKENAAEDNFKIIKNRDKKKLKLCKEHNIDMIYINHFDSDEDIENKIKNIII